MHGEAELGSRLKIICKLPVRLSILRAPKAATVKATPANDGDSLAVDQVIVEFE